MFKGIRLMWADKFALVLTVLVAAAALLCWVLGIVGLDGHPNMRFDQAMLDWTTQLELIFVPVVWLLLRGADLTARTLFQGLRSGLAHISSRASFLPTYPAPGIRVGEGTV